MAASDVNLRQGHAVPASVILRQAGGSGPINYTENVSETVTLSESLVALFSAVQGLAEGVSLSEALATAFAAVSGLSETVTLVEATSQNYGANQSLAEGVSLAEALSSVRAVIIALSDSVSLAEALVAVVGDTVAFSESVTLSESLASKAEYTGTLAEMLSLVEALAAGQVFTADVAETVTISEKVDVSYSANVVLATLLALAEQLGIEADITPVEIAAVLVDILPSLRVHVMVGSGLEFPVDKLYYGMTATFLILLRSVRGFSVDPDNLRITLTKPTGVTIDAVYATGSGRLIRDNVGAFQFETPCDFIGDATWTVTASTTREVYAKGTLHVYPR